MSKVILKEGRFGNGPAKVPCKECPLARKSIPGYLGGYTPMMYIEALNSDADIACHMSKGFPKQDYPTMRSCTGVAQYRKNVGKYPRGGGALDAVEAVAHDPVNVFSSPFEFLAHHGTVNRAGGK